MPKPPAPPRVTQWRRLPISKTELCITMTLQCGQSFRWRRSPTDANEWLCSLRGRVVALRQDETSLWYRAFYPAADSNGDNAKRASATNGKRTSSSETLTVSRRKKRKIEDDGREVKLETEVKIKEEDVLPTPPESIRHSPPSSSTTTETQTPPETTNEDFAPYDAPDDTLPLLTHYFNLHPNLRELYAHWSRVDTNFAAKAPGFTGIRIMRQDCWEALLGFICSSNNHIKRIGGMVENLCIHYGKYIATIDNKAYYDFPTPEALTTPPPKIPSVESHLRALGFGYRAKYIATTASLIANEKGGLPWLDSLRNPLAPTYNPSIPASEEKEQNGTDPVPQEGRQGYLDAHAALLSLQGVGPKVADCVCLMGLGWSEAVPVDTHVYQIALRDYKVRGLKKGALLNKALYEAVAGYFRQLWGVEAGWAHSVLFTADLRSFKDRGGKGKKEEEEKEEEAVKEEAKVEGEVFVKKEDGGDGAGVEVLFREEITMPVPVSGTAAAGVGDVKTEVGDDGMDLYGRRRSRRASGRAVKIEVEETAVKTKAEKGKRAKR